MQAPFKDRPEYVHCAKLAEDIADLLAPQSGAYYDIWLDGEKFVSAQMEVSAHFPLPRCLCQLPALPCLKTVLHCRHQCAKCATVHDAVIAAEARLLPSQRGISFGQEYLQPVVFCVWALAPTHLLPACAALACGLCGLLGSLNPCMAVQITMHEPYHSSVTTCRAPK